jgi:hypothetical protein
VDNYDVASSAFDVEAGPDSASCAPSPGHDPSRE